MPASTDSRALVDRDWADLTREIRERPDTALRICRGLESAHVLPRQVLATLDDAEVGLIVLLARLAFAEAMLRGFEHD